MAKHSDHEPSKRVKPVGAGERLTAFYRTGDEEGTVSDGNLNFHGLEPVKPKR